MRLVSHADHGFLGSLPTSPPFPGDSAFPEIIGVVVAGISAEADHHEHSEDEQDAGHDDHDGDEIGILLDPGLGLLPEPLEPALLRGRGHRCRCLVLLPIPVHCRVVAGHYS